MFDKCGSPAVANKNYRRRICNTCDEDHSFRPNFEGVKTSIEIIPVLLEKLVEREWKVILS
jgi:hypothetical protein